MTTEEDARVETTIRACEERDVDAVVALSLRAWRPVFESFAHVLGAEVYARLYPDWRESQARAVASVLRAEGTTTWVAEHAGRPVGFVAVVLHEDPPRGEIEMLAVDPDHQGRGTGTALTVYAVEYLRGVGVPLVEIVTGGDPGHAPARRTYEKAGFTALPLVRYYRAV